MTDEKRIELREWAEAEVGSWHVDAALRAHLEKLCGCGEV